MKNGNLNIKLFFWLRNFYERNYLNTEILLWLRNFCVVSCVPVWCGDFRFTCVWKVKVIFKQKILVSQPGYYFIPTDGPCQKDRIFYFIFRSFSAESKMLTQACGNTGTWQSIPLCDWREIVIQNSFAYWAMFHYFQKALVRGLLGAKSKNKRETLLSYVIT